MIIELGRVTEETRGSPGASMEVSTGTLSRMDG